MSISVNVILPEARFSQRQQADKQGKVKIPVLYLLHGLSDDHSAWQRYTSIERFVQDKNLAVVMPTVHRSFYTDMDKGLKYWEFVSEELPFLMQSLFPISAAREDNFVAGLSMGGYGAFKLGLRNPERFAAAASLSGALDIIALGERKETLTEFEFNNIFAGLDEASGSDNDLFALVSRAVEAGIELPQLFQCCGTEDFLYKDNQGFLKHLKALDINVTYEEGPGAHDWHYWNEHIQRVIQWLPLK